MSLLNDMLRDLSHQQERAATVASSRPAELEFNAHEQRELFYSTSSAKPLPRTLLPSIIVFIVVLTALALWKLDVFTPANPVPATTEEAAYLPKPLFNSISSTPSIATKVNVANDRNDQSGFVAVPATGSASAADDNLGDRIAALESAITNLSTLVANASQQTYSTVSDSDHDFGNNIISNNQEDDYAAAAVETDGLVASSHAGDDAQHETLAVDKSQSVSIQEPFVQSQIAQGESHLSISPNAKWKDEQQAREAKELLMQGQADTAIENLQRFIVSTEQPRESMKALLDIFIEQENVDAVRNLLEQATYLSVADQTFYYAKAAVIQQQDTKAIQLLEAHLDDAEKNENYRSLLAGLYQRNGMHLEAANHYRRLLSVFGDKPAYWLGFALAQDSLNQPQVAAQAYQRVNQYADLQPQVRTYIQQRIAALQQ